MASLIRIEEINSIGQLLFRLDHHRFVPCVGNFLQRGTFSSTVLCRQAFGFLGCDTFLRFEIMFAAHATDLKKFWSSFSQTVSQQNCTLQSWWNLGVCVYQPEPEDTG